MDAQAGRRPDRQGREAPGPTLAGRGGGGWRLSVQVPFLFSGPFAVRKWSGGMATGRKKARLNLPRIAVGSKEGAREEGVDLDAGPLPSAGVAHATGEGDCARARPLGASGRPGFALV